MLERTGMQSPFYTAEHEAFREVMRRFVSREIEPYAHEWDEAGEFPRELYRKASEIGLLGLGFPEEHGGAGTGNDFGLAAAYATARLLRLADGPDEVHRNQIARLELRKHSNA